MPDITVPGIAGERESGAIPSRPAPGRSAYQAAQGDDDLLARLLITSWTLATGRTLRDDVPPALLSEEELISFWADDQILTAGLTGTTAAGPAGLAGPTGPAGRRAPAPADSRR